MNNYKPVCSHLIKEGERHFSSFIIMTRAVEFHSYRLFCIFRQNIFICVLLFYCTWHAFNSLVHFSKALINFNIVSCLNRRSVVILFLRDGKKTVINFQSEQLPLIFLFMFHWMISCPMDCVHSSMIIAPFSFALLSWKKILRCI